ncbi:MAG: BTAD domain-containing putative transcriptional regulator, partial [Bacillota bacterium]|nr:BTAD domain-containing putative transcriptional regulator [Bacillota bacterium]
MIRVHLLGRFEMLTLKGEVCIPTVKVRLLAAYLFWQQDHWVRRELLRGLLWGDLDEERASGNLRTALYFFRRSLSAAGVSENLLQSRRDEVRVAPGPECMVDARLFEEKAWLGLQKDTKEVESLMAAVTLYRGDFLSEMDAEWCIPERRRLADLHLSVLCALVERLAALGMHSAAVSYASRWLDVDPLDEAAHQTLMRLYAAMGQPARVVEQYEQCRQVLQAELGISPGEPTERLFKELGAAAEKGAERRPGNSSGRRRRALRSRAAGQTPKPLFAEKRFSEDPLRNARLLLVSGEALALLGETEEGIRSLEKALTLYDRFSGLASRARLLLGEALMWLSIPLAPKMDSSLREKGLRYIEQSLEYYRANGPPADLGRALQLGAQACWLVGLNSRAVELAQEGLALVSTLGDREAEARLAALLAMSLREEYRLAEALEVFDRAVECVPYMTTPWEILWIIFQRGILSYIIGDLAEAERFLREALELIRATTFPSLMIKVGECMTRSMMIVVLHYQDLPQEMGEFLKPEMDRYNPEPFIYLNSLFSAGEDRRSLLPGVEGWLRTRLFRLPGPMIACTIRSVVEEMLAAGLFREAACWAGVGVRLARTRDWGAFEAF